MKKTLTATLFLLVFFFASNLSFAALVNPEEVSMKSNRILSDGNHPLDDYKKLKISDVENYFGRKMTFAEKAAFKINKKKYVEYVKADEDKSSKTNGMAIAGFVTSFFIGPLGIIFSAIALGKIKKTGEKGKGLAIAGLIIGIASTLFWIL